MSEKFNTVTVDEPDDTSKTSRISFPAHNNLTVREAEDFWSDLMNAVMAARKIDRDPL